MRIVRESLENKQNLEFIRNVDPLKALGVGIVNKIEKWLEDMSINKYKINNDLTVDIYSDLVLSNKNLVNLPEFIKFNIIYGGFYGSGNIWTNLSGFPNTVNGDFQLVSYYQPINPNRKKFTEEEIYEKINVFGKLYL